MGQSSRTSRQEIRHRIFHPFATIQATKQWEDREIPQVPKNMYQQTHQPWIGMGLTHTNGNSMLQLLSKLQCQRISILHHVQESLNPQTQHVTALSKKIFS